MVFILRIFTTDADFTSSPLIFVIFPSATVNVVSSPFIKPSGTTVSLIVYVPLGRFFKTADLVPVSHLSSLPLIVLAVPSAASSTPSLNSTSTSFAEVASIVLPVSVRVAPLTGSPATSDLEILISFVATASQRVSVLSPSKRKYASSEVGVFCCLREVWFPSTVTAPFSSTVNFNSVFVTAYVICVSGSVNVSPVSPK